VCTRYDESDRDGDDESGRSTDLPHGVPPMFALYSQEGVFKTDAHSH